MFASILVPLDGSELAEEVLDPVARLLLREDAELILLRAIEPRRGEDERQLHERRDGARAALARVEERLSGQGARCRSLVEDGDPADVILTVASRERPALVAMTTHGRSGLSRWVRGSVAERVLRRCPTPLLLARPRGEDAEPMRFARLLVPLDGSDRGNEVLPMVADLASRHGAPVVLLKVGFVEPAPVDFPMQTVPPPQVTEEELAAAVEPARRQLEAAGVTVRVQSSWGLPAGEIIDASQEPGTLLVMTTHGRSGLDRWLLGSVAEKVLRHSTCPVLLKRVAAFEGKAP